MQIRRRVPRVLMYCFGFQPPAQPKGEPDSPGEGDGDGAASPPDPTELNAPIEEAGAPPEPPTPQE